MDISDIAAASIDLSQIRTDQAVGVAMLKKSMDSQQENGNAVIQCMQASMAGIGANLDIRA